MNPQDRQLLDALNLRHERLETAVALLKTDLQQFSTHLETPALTPSPVLPQPVSIPEPAAAVLPPIPAEPVPISTGYAIPAEIPAAPAQVSAPSAPRPEGPGFEIQFGRWLARIGVVFALLTLVFFSVVAYKDFYQYFGPWSKLGVLALVSTGLFGAGLWLERKSRDLVVYGRTLAGGGLACLYYTLYGASYVRQLEVIHSPVLGGLLLLAWSAGVLWLAERRKSELLSIFAISLAYFSSTITPVGGFTMAADLLLAATAVAFLVRNAWTGLSYLCLFGTYLGFVRQIFLGQPDVPFSFDLVPNLAFGPSAIYLTGAWVIFTAGIFLAKAPGFDGGKRLAFLSLNNGAWIGLLVVAAQLSGFHHVGGMLLLAGVALLGAWLLARLRRAEANDVEAAYLMQGLAIGTAGVVIAYSGVTRGLIITAESVFLAAAGAYSHRKILRFGAGLAASLGTSFLVHEITIGQHHPWVLTFAGAAAMLANAWFARFDFWREPFETARSRFVWPTVVPICLAMGLLVAGIVSQGDEKWISPELALASLALAGSIYFLPLFELPPLSQSLLFPALLGSFGFPIIVDEFEPGPSYQPDPQWSQDIVALVTMLFVLWWPRQTRVVKGRWLAPFMLAYALAMVAFTYNAIHPHVGEQAWMMWAAAMSLVFLAFGAWNRSWAFIVSGQILLALSVITFFGFDKLGAFPWTWWASAVPIAVVFVTGWIAHQVLPYVFRGNTPMRDALRIVARVYQSVAIGLLVRWIFGVVPADEITLALFALSTAFIGGGALGSSSYFVRAGLVLDVVGCYNYVLAGLDIDVHAFTWLDAGASALFLAQPALLRRWGRELVSDGESWLVILASSAASWLFVSNSIAAADSQNLTLGWALLALTLIVIGFAANERRLRWCGFGVLVAAFARVAAHDFWGFSDGGKVLTFFALTVICLGLSFLYYKFADRLKEWL